jgi:hypothetical protein
MQKNWRPIEPVLRIGGEVPIKIQSMIAHPTEVSAFGICSSDSLNVVDLMIPKQICSVGSTLMDDEDLANETVRLAKDGTPPLMCNRIWIHTHPGGGIPTPSGRDWECFNDLIDNGWAVMLIFANGGGYYCRYGFKVGEEKSMVEIPVFQSMAFWHHPKTKLEIEQKVELEKQTWTVPKYMRRGKKEEQEDMRGREYSIWGD